MIKTKYIKPDWMTAEERYMRDGFGKAMVEMGQVMSNLVVLTADLGESLRLNEFKERFPKKFFNVGVAEQNMIGVAAGLAAENWVPVTTSFGVFSPGRSWDQIRVSVCYSKANVKLVGSHGGIATGEDGATHQALEDIAMMQVLPETVVLAPADYSQAKLATEAMLKYDGPVYLRLVRPKSVNFTKEVEFEVGKAYVYREGRDVSLLTYGLQVWEGLRAAEELSKGGIEVEVINVSTIKPLDKDTLLESIKKTGRVVVVEDHQLRGGLGSEVARLIVEEGLKVSWKQMGMRDKFGESGNWRELYHKYGLDWKGIVREIQKILSNTPAI